MLNYCVRDVQLNTLVLKELKKEAKGFSKESVCLEHDIADIMKRQEQDGFKFHEINANLLLAELRQEMQSIEDEVHETFQPKWVDDKLVTPYIRKDGVLSPKESEAHENKCTTLANDVYSLGTIGMELMCPLTFSWRDLNPNYWDKY